MSVKNVEVPDLMKVIKSESRNKKEKNKTRADRINIILLFHQGYNGVEISGILHLDQDTVSKWKARYLARIDDQSWLKDNYKPYVGKLSYHSISILRGYVQTFLVGSDLQYYRKLICDSFV